MFYRVEFFSLGRIRSGLVRIVEVPLCSSHQDTQVRIKRLLSSSVSSPDWSPQAKENLHQSCSTTTKSCTLNFSESTPSNAMNKENTRLDVNQEISNCLLLLLMNIFFLLSAHVKMILRCNNTIFDGSRYYFYEQFVILKQSKT